MHFNVYTFKEGAFSTINIEIKLTESQHSKMIENFNTLLEFKKDYDEKIHIFYREEYGTDDDNENFSDDNPDPAEESDESSNDN
jgi:hypothetical protein